MTITLISNDPFPEPKIIDNKNEKYINQIHKLIPKYQLDQIISSSILKSEQPNKEYSYDILIENERGAIILGFPFYTKYMLPCDPPSFTNINGSKITNLKLFPLPDLNWNWTWDKWYVIMSDDTDDQGWIYSWRFGSNHWRGEQKFGCFVRKRLWLRLREKDLINTIDDEEEEKDYE